MTKVTGGCHSNMWISCFSSEMSLKDKYTHEWVLSLFSRVQLFVTLWTVAHWLFCPGVSPGKNTQVGCHALLQGIFPNQGSNLHLLCLLYWQAGSLPVVYICQSQSPNSSHSFSPLVSIHLFSTSVSLFLLCK